MHKFQNSTGMWPHLSELMNEQLCNNICIDTTNVERGYSFECRVISTVTASASRKLQYYGKSIWPFPEQCMTSENTPHQIKRCTYSTFSSVQELGLQSVVEHWWRIFDNWNAVAYFGRIVRDIALFIVRQTPIFYIFRFASSSFHKWLVIVRNGYKRPNHENLFKIFQNSYHVIT